MSVQNKDHHEFSSEFVNDMGSSLNDHDPDMVALFFTPFRSSSPPYSFSEYTHLPSPSSSHRPLYDPQDALTSLLLSDSVYPDMSRVLDLSPWSMATHRGLAPEMSIQPEKLSMGAYDKSSMDSVFSNQDPLSKPLGAPILLDPSGDPNPLEPAFSSAPMGLP
ncbi:hypothetical protein BG003_001958, partial [Podila horticola]